MSTVKSSYRWYDKEDLEKNGVFPAFLGKFSDKSDIYPGVVVLAAGRLWSLCLAQGRVVAFFRACRSVLAFRQLSGGSGVFYSGGESS